MRSFIFLLGLTGIDCRNVLVMGRTGTGKSSLINSLRGSADALVSDDSTGTTEVIGFPFEDLEHGLSLVFWDTPGFYDAQMESGMLPLFKAIQDDIQVVSSILFVINADSDRMGVQTEEVNGLKLLFQAFGPEIWKRVIIVLSKCNSFSFDATKLKLRLMKSVLSDLVSSNFIEAESLPVVVAGGRGTHGMSVRPRGWNLMILSELASHIEDIPVHVRWEKIDQKLLSLKDNLSEFVTREGEMLLEKFARLEDRVVKLLEQKRQSEEVLEKLNKEIEEVLNAQDNQDSLENDEIRQRDAAEEKRIEVHGQARDELINGLDEMTEELQEAEENLQEIERQRKEYVKRERKNGRIKVFIGVVTTIGGFALARHSNKFKLADKIGNLLVAMRGGC